MLHILEGIKESYSIAFVPKRQMEGMISFLFPVTRIIQEL